MKVISLITFAALISTSVFATPRQPRRDLNIPGARYVMEVLPGILYRGGGPGGMQQMPDTSLLALCEAGFTTAVYLYPQTGFEARSVSCAAGTIDYVSSGFQANGRSNKPALEAIHQHVTGTKPGRIFVHCWNGCHSSGEVAAAALKQFCGWDGDAAADYWDNWSCTVERGSASTMSRLRSFQPLAALVLTAEQQAVVCPQ